MKQEIMKPLKGLKHLTHSVMTKHQVQHLIIKVSGQQDLERRCNVSQCDREIEGLFIKHCCS